MKAPEEGDDDDEGPPREFLSPPLPVSPCSKKREQWTVPQQHQTRENPKKETTDPGARRLAAAMIRQAAASDAVFPFHLQPTSPTTPTTTGGPRSPRRAQLAPRVDLGADYFPTFSPPPP